MKTKGLKVEMRALDALIPYARNARTHSAAQVAQIAASVREFGWTNPLLVAQDGTVIAGHGRLLAARKLGMVEVPCIMLDHLTETQRRALVLADNRLALSAGWDDETLAIELLALRDDGFEIPVLGFDDVEIRRLIEPMPKVAEIVEEPEESEIVSSAGDLYELGPHRLLVGDSTDAASVSRVLDVEPMLMLFDPPYDMDFLSWTLPESVQVACIWHRCKSGMQWIMERCGGDAWGYHAILFTGGVRGQHNHTLPSCMHDQVHVLRRKWWTDKMEALDREVLKRCGAKVCQDGRHYSWQEGVGGVLTNVSHGMSWGKPTFETEIMLAYTPRDAVVWDPCAGSGSSLLASAKHGRTWRGMEHQPKWADLIRRRWHRFATDNGLEVGDGLQ